MRVVDFSKIKISCETCCLAELCLPRGLTAENLDTLDRIIGRSHPLQKGSILFRANDPLNSLYAVRSGSMKLSTLTDDAQEQVIGFYLPGEILGFDAIEHGKHVCTSSALETSTVCNFPYKDLVRICHEVPALQEQLLRFMGHELSQEQSLLLNISKQNAEQRISTFLLSLSTRYKRLGYSAREFKLSMSRQDIANYLGLTIETVSRTLSRFQEKGTLEIKHKMIAIRDMDSLEIVCGINRTRLAGDISVA